MVRQSDTDVYDKWAQALSSAFEPAESSCFAAEKHSVKHFFTALLPVVVLPDGVLWTATYNDDGNILADPTQTKECTLFVGREINVLETKQPIFYQTFTFSHVHFFTLSGFESFLSRMAVNDLSWDRLFYQKALEI